MVADGGDCDELKYLEITASSSSVRSISVIRGVPRAESVAIKLGDIGLEFPMTVGICIATIAFANAGSSTATISFASKLRFAWYKLCIFLICVIFSLISWIFSFPLVLIFDFEELLTFREFRLS